MIVARLGRNSPGFSLAQPAQTPTPKSGHASRTGSVDNLETGSNPSHSVGTDPPRIATELTELLTVT